MGQRQIKKTIDVDDKPAGECKLARSSLLLLLLLHRLAGQGVARHACAHRTVEFSYSRYIRPHRYA